MSEPDKTLWDSKEEKEKHRRIQVSVAAFASQKMNLTLYSDAKYFELAYQIDLTVDTGNVKLDNFFRDNFVPFSKDWIWDHPEQEALRETALLVGKINGVIP